MLLSDQTIPTSSFNIMAGLCFHIQTSCIAILHPIYWQLGSLSTEVMWLEEADHLHLVPNLECMMNYLHAPYMPQLFDVCTQEKLKPLTVPHSTTALNRGGTFLRHASQQAPTNFIISKCH
jgi:hypothetical protein